MSIPAEELSSISIEDLLRKNLDVRAHDVFERHEVGIQLKPPKAVSSITSGVSNLGVSTAAAREDHVHGIANETWTAYTPTWAGSGGNPSLGTTVVQGRYIRLGKVVHANVVYSLGASFTGGSGVYTWTLPVQAFGTNSPVIGNGMCWNNDYYPLAAQVQSSGLAINLATLRNSGVYNGLLTATTPFTFAAGHYLSFSVTYEAA